MAVKKKPHEENVIYGSQEYDYDDSVLEIYGIKDGEMDEEAEEDFEAFIKVIANNPKRKE